jgi:uncharacterized protein
MFDLVAFLRQNPGIALVGATNHSQKFGNIIMKDMMRKGYKMIPVNPRAKSVEGLQAFPDLTSARKNEDIGLVVYVIPPALTRQSLDEALNLGLKKVWIQPGAGDESVRGFLDEHGFEYLMDACVMVESRS